MAARSTKQPDQPLAPRITRGGWQWTTADELGFLEGLGTFQDDNACVRVADRRTLLVRYLAAMPLRQEWGKIDAMRVRITVHGMLRETRL